MSLLLQIKTQIPSFIESDIEREHFDIISNHYISEITYVKSQRPTPTPAEIAPRTPIGENLETVLSLIDDSIEIYNQTADVPIAVNPYRNQKFISKWILTAFNTAFENNLQGLLNYYNTPNPAPPPDGYPTTPIPKPITIPAPVIPPLVPATLNAYIKQIINDNISSTDPQVVITALATSYISGWSNFLVSEVFL